jgi:hypothetical protein
MQFGQHVGRRPDRRSFIGGSDARIIARRHQRSAPHSNLRIIKPGERPATDIPAAA